MKEALSALTETLRACGATGDKSNPAHKLAENLYASIRADGSMSAGEKSMVCARIDRKMRAALAAAVIGEMP